MIQYVPSVILDVLLSRHADSRNYRGPLICKKEFSSIPLTYQEKKQLKSDINKLPGDKLGDLLNIIRNRETCIQETAPDKVEVDFELLKTATLRALQRFVASCFTKCIGHGKSKYTYAWITQLLADCFSPKLKLKIKSILSESTGLFCFIGTNLKAKGGLLTEKIKDNDKRFISFECARNKEKQLGKTWI